MITPLMHILSCLDEKREVGAPVDVLYLSRSDRELVIQEAERLGSLFNDENKVWITDSPCGRKMVSEIQVVAGKSVTLNPYTALLLTRVWQCFPMYTKEINAVPADAAEDDLSADAVVLRLEGNPRYVYIYVYNVMEMPALSYDDKIKKLRDVLLTLKSRSVVKDSELRNDRLLQRLELHSMQNYWAGMLMSDYITYYGTIPPAFEEETIEVLRKELSDLGFYGFVNPLQMYEEFTHSRVARKVNVTVEEFVIEFLTKVVLSGGANVE